jgi:hypothetical protein
MAKFTYRPASSPDDPIYTGRFVISSHGLSQKYEQSKKSSPAAAAGPEEATSLTAEQKYPDLQNLPFDPAVEALKKLKD